MKKLILSALLLSSLFVSAQDKKSLEERANKAVEYTLSGEYDKLMDYTYPKVFTIVPRDVLSKMFKDMLKGDGFTINIVKTPPNFKFGEIKKIDNAYYSIIEHDLQMNMVFDDPIADGDIDETIKVFKEAMKSNDITYDKLTKTLKIKKRSQMVAVADESTKKLWTYINNDGGPLLAKLIPEKAIKQLGLKQ